VSDVYLALFYWLDDSYNVMGVLACHMDDFISSGAETFSTRVIPHLKIAFQFGCEENNNSFSYIGMEVHSLEHEKHVQQSIYIDNLQPIPVNPTRITQ